MTDMFTSEDPERGSREISATLTFEGSESPALWNYLEGISTGDSGGTRYSFSPSIPSGENPWYASVNPSHVTEMSSQSILNRPEPTNEEWRAALQSLVDENDRLLARNEILYRIHEMNVQGTVRVVKTLELLQDAIEDTNRMVVRLLTEFNETSDAVNREIDQMGVDRI